MNLIALLKEEYQKKGKLDEFIMLFYVDGSVEKLILKKFREEVDYSVFVTSFMPELCKLFYYRKSKILYVYCCNFIRQTIFNSPLYLVFWQKIKKRCFIKIVEKK